MRLFTMFSAFLTIETSLRYSRVACPLDAAK